MPQRSFFFILLSKKNPLLIIISSSSPPFFLSKRANLFPQVTDLFCRLPLPTLPYLTRGFSPRGPAAVIGTTWLENNSIPSFFKDHCFYTLLAAIGLQVFQKKEKEILFRTSNEKKRKSFTFLEINSFHGFKLLLTTKGGHRKRTFYFQNLYNYNDL